MNPGSLITPKYSAGCDVAASHPIPDTNQGIRLNPSSFSCTQDIEYYPCGGVFVGGGSVYLSFNRQNYDFHVRHVFSVLSLILSLAHSVDSLVGMLPRIGRVHLRSLHMRFNLTI